MSARGDEPEFLAWREQLAPLVPASLPTSSFDTAAARPPQDEAEL